MANLVSADNWILSIQAVNISESFRQFEHNHIYSQVQVLYWDNFLFKWKELKQNICCPLKASLTDKNE